MNEAPEIDRDEELPMLIVEHGRPLYSRMNRMGVKVEDILAVARSVYGIERLDQIRYALLETDGGISIIPCTASPELSTPPPLPPTEQMK